MPHGVDQRRHQVDLGVGGLGAQPGERGVDGACVAVVAHLVEPLELAGLVLVGDLQQLDLVVVVALGEGVDPDDRSAGRR